jgi:hypothetical protein
MKTKAPSIENKSKGDDLRVEYKFDYSKAKPNRFAGKVRPGSFAVFAGSRCG